MTYEVETHGTRRTVDVQRVGREWTVRLDGRTVAVSVSQVGDRWSLLIGPPEGGPYDAGPPDGGPYDAGPPDGGPHIDKQDDTQYVGAASRRPMKSYEVSFGARVNGEQLVYVRGTAVPVSLLDPRERLTRGSTGATHVAAGPRSIVAPMPGRIVKVLVRPGDRVAAHQGLVVIEAMKMENELRAPKAGTVVEVRVRDGMSVEARAVLIVLD